MSARAKLLYAALTCAWSNNGVEYKSGQGTEGITRHHALVSCKLFDTISFCTVAQVRLASPVESLLASGSDRRQGATCQNES